MQKPWTPKRIKTGFDIFIKQNGRLPLASEIDVSDHLPSSRYIQKRFGGLEFLREQLGYTDTHFGKGSFRSNIATRTGADGRKLESDFELTLYNYFDESCVEVEKAFYGKQRIDFYISNDEGNFGIDIFYAQTMRTLQSSVNIKMKKYINFTDTLYLVVANPSLKQKDLDIYAKRKNLPFAKDVYLVSLETLHKILVKKTESKKRT